MLKYFSRLSPLVMLGRGQLPRGLQVPERDGGLLRAQPQGDPKGHTAGWHKYTVEIEFN